MGLPVPIVEMASFNSWTNNKISFPIQLIRCLELESYFPILNLAGRGRKMKHGGIAAILSLGCRN